MPVTRGIVVDWAYSAGYQCERSLAYIHTGVYTAIYSWVWLYNSRVLSPRDRALDTITSSTNTVSEVNRS